MGGRGPNTTINRLKKGRGHKTQNNFDQFQSLLVNDGSGTQPHTQQSTAGSPRASNHTCRSVGPFVAARELQAARRIVITSASRGCHAPAHCRSGRGSYVAESYVEGSSSGGSGWCECCSLQAVDSACRIHASLSRAGSRRRHLGSCVDLGAGRGACACIFVCGDARAACNSAIISSYRKWFARCPTCWPGGTGGMRGAGEEGGGGSSGSGGTRGAGRLLGEILARNRGTAAGAAGFLPRPRGGEARGRAHGCTHCRCLRQRLKPVIRIAV